MKRNLRRITTLLLCCLSIAIAVGQAQERPFAPDEGLEGWRYSPVYGENIDEINPGNGLAFNMYNEVATADGMAAFAAPIPVPIAAAAAAVETITLTWITDSMGFNIYATYGKTFSVDWGDSSQDTYTGNGTSTVTPAPSHIYGSSGTYTVTITGNEADCFITGL